MELEIYKVILDINNYVDRIEKLINTVNNRFVANIKDKFELESIVQELHDCLNDVYQPNWYVEGIIDAYKLDTYKTIQEKAMRIKLLAIAFATRLKRKPNFYDKTSQDYNDIIKENIFIIHGQAEDQLVQLKNIIKDKFKLNPIVLKEQVSGIKTIIENFERIAKTCSFAIALFTPDDVIDKGGKKYTQARPNTLFELGWFCCRLGRDKVVLALKEGTEVFSDFHGVVQKRFNNSVSEIEISIRKELEQLKIIDY